MTEAMYWLRCPECGGLGQIDDDQLHGRVSVLCDDCGYHETRDWSGVSEAERTWPREPSGGSA